MLMLRTLFEEQLLEDRREAVVTFQIPFIDGQWGLLLPSMLFWAQIGAYFLLEVLLLFLLAIPTYEFVVRKKGGNTTAYIFGYGVIIPLVFLIPYEIMKFFVIRSRMLAMTVCSLPTFATLRCLEAMHGFTPQGAKESLGNFILYFSLVLEVLFDPQTKSPIRSTSKDIAKNATTSLAMYILASVLMSWMRPYHFEPFETRVDSHTVDHSIHELFLLGHIGNNFIAAFLFYVVTNFGNKLFELTANLLLGYKTKDYMDNPFFRSKSPSDFWIRWNKVVQGLMKRGIYKPVLQQFHSSAVALMAVFLFSGLLHEFVNTIVFFVHPEVNDDNNNDDQHQNLDNEGQTKHAALDNTYYATPMMGKALMFFLWNGALVGMEKLLSWLGRQQQQQQHNWTLLFRWMSRMYMHYKPPRLVVSLLVVSLTLPISHLFTGDWVHGQFFHHLSMGLPLFVRMDRSTII